MSWFCYNLETTCRSRRELEKHLHATLQVSRSFSSNVCSKTNKVRVKKPSRFNFLKRGDFLTRLRNFRGVKVTKFWVGNCPQKFFFRPIMPLLKFEVRVTENRKLPPREEKKSNFPPWEKKFFLSISCRYLSEGGKSDTSSVCYLIILVQSRFLSKIQFCCTFARSYKRLFLQFFKRGLSKF